MLVSVEAITHPPNPLPPRSESVLPRTVGISTCFLFLALTTYVLRIWVRVRAGTRLGWDDAAITVAMGITTAMWAMATIVTVQTGGWHVWYLPANRLEDLARTSWIFLMVWQWAVATIKISVSLMLIRIKGDSRPWFIGLWVLIAVLVLSSAAFTTCLLLICNPIQANWQIKYLLQPEKCWSANRFLATTYIFNSIFLVTDVVCALLPIAFIRKINRPLREKITLSALMGMGLIAAVCGLMKMLLFKETAYSSDPSFTAAKAEIWAFAEAFIGIITANIPCLKSLLESLFYKLGGRLTSRKSQSTLSPSYVTDSNNSPPDAKRDSTYGYHSAVRSIHAPVRTLGKAELEEMYLVGDGALRPSRSDVPLVDHHRDTTATGGYDAGWEERKIGFG